MTFQLRGGRSELRWSKDLDARRLCSIRQSLLALNPIWCGSDRTDHDIDTLKGRREGGPVVIIDGGEPGTLCNPFRVRRTWILEVREYKSGSQRRLHGRLRDAHRRSGDDGNRRYGPDGFQPQQLRDDKTPNIPSSNHSERMENHLVVRGSAKGFSRWGLRVANGGCAMASCLLDAQRS